MFTNKCSIERLRDAYGEDAIYIDFCARLVDVDLELGLELESETIKELKTLQPKKNRQPPHCTVLLRISVPFMLLLFFSLDS